MADLLPKAGLVLAVLFIGTSFWTLFSVARIRSEIAERVGVITTLGQAQSASHALRRAVQSTEWHADSSEASSLWLDLRAALQRELDPIDRSSAETAEMLPHLYRTTLALGRMDDLHDEFVAAWNARADVDAQLTPFLREAEGIHAELSSAISAERAQTSHLSTRLWRTWFVTTLLLVFSCLLAIASTIQLFRTRRRIDELALAQAELRRSQEELRAVLAHAPVIFWTTDAEERCLILEGSALAKLGPSRAQRIGRRISEIFPDQPELERKVRRALAGEKHTCLVSSDGVTFLMSIIPSRDELGVVRGLIGLATDITEQLRAQMALQRTQEERSESLKLEAVGRLAGGISHEFSNLLTVINGFATLAQVEVPSDSHAHADLEKVLKASQQASTLTQQLLAFSRRQPHDPRVIDINEELRQTVAMLRSLLGERIEVRSELAAEPHFVYIDPGRLEQVVLNLALNARDAMPDGGVLHLTTSLRALDENDRAGFPSLAPGAYAWFVVEDTGSGMSEDVRRRAFEPFFTTKQVGKGTGLGLATCHGIIGQAGGGITVESQPGHGTCFTIALPIARPVAEVVHDTGLLEPPLPHGHETILLAEDEQSVRAFTARVLHELGYTVLEACNGVEALELARSHGERIGVLVTDLVMPVMGGIELAEVLQEKCPALPVLYVSGYCSLEIAPPHGNRSCLFLQKPYAARDLADGVRRLLDAADRRAASSTAEPSSQALAAGAVLAPDARSSAGRAS
jgi:PAS domain S-box-containing protein